MYIKKVVSLQTIITNHNNMKSINMNILFTLIIMLMCSLAANAQYHSAPAFPGAEGFGRYASGGRGGKVYHVTNLNDYCDDSKYGSKVADKSEEAQGTLRWALRKKGARIIVFDVAGTIDLVCPLRINNDSVTILGQTAPGDGVCLKNYTVGIHANNVVIRYLRCRMGDECRTEDDAMNSAHRDNDIKKNVIIDHCSLSWSTDECGSFYGVRDFTLQWCILSESLRSSVHDKGKHGYGGIWGGESASFHHNLIAHHDSRNPRFDHGYLSELAGPVDYVNNVVYNWGQNSTYGGENHAGCEAKKFNMINNFYKPGPYTQTIAGRSDRLLNPTTQCSNCNKEDKTNVVPGKFFISGNIVNDEPATVSKKNISFDGNYSLDLFKQNCILSERALSDDYDFKSYSTISVHSARKAYESVVAYAGASFKRDMVDAEVCDDVRNGTARYRGSKTGDAGLIDSQNDRKGSGESAWQKLQGASMVDTDRDGIPDEWEKAHGLNPNSAKDASAFSLDEKGYYTNIEVYANSLVEEIVKAGRSDAECGFEEYYVKLIQ